MRFWWGLLVLLSGTAAMAQGSPLTIEQRLEKLERENADLKRQLKARPAAPAAVQTPAADKLTAGWTMLLYPKPFKGQELFPIGAFVGKSGGFRFGDIRTQTSHAGWASFKGEGKFFAYAEGPYSFSIEVRGTERNNFPIKMTCDVALRIDDTDLIPADQGQFFIEHMGAFDRTLPGGKKLTAGAHPIEFQVGCQFNNGFRGVTADEMFQSWPKTKMVFDDIRVTINVFGPTDRTARPLRDEEIGHERKRTTTVR